MPAEWEPHRAAWLAWPHDKQLWGPEIARVVDEFVALCKIIASDGNERVELLVHESSDATIVREIFDGYRVEIHRARYGDIWLRDTAPVFVRRGAELAAVAFQFNGWGRKYELDGDTEVATTVAGLAGASLHRLPWVGEGGAFEMNGAGLCLASRACILSPSRNPDLSEIDIERSLRDAFGVERVVWFDPILMGDHTDGHVDTLARFVSRDTVVCARSSAHDGPNASALRETRETLQAVGGLTVVTVPSPGAVTGDDGSLLPASYLNFYIANDAVVVPTYGTEFDDQAVAVLSGCFPERRVVGSSARAILDGGGAFHCITQQEPRV